jgi:Mg/Co/Ni transporter MgtE
MAQPGDMQERLNALPSEARTRIGELIGPGDPQEQLKALSPEVRARIAHLIRELSEGVPPIRGVSGPR